MNLRTSQKPLLVSVFDCTGEWAKPYIEAGWRVLLWDRKYEGDILEWFGSLCENIENALCGQRLTGLIGAPPCTDFTVSGAQYWNEKDCGKRWWPGETGDEKDTQYFKTTTERSIALVLIFLELVNRFNPFFWALENPVGRIERLVPELRPWRKMSFNPCDYGDPYTKRTILWGNFNADLPKNPVDPEYVIAKNGDKYSPNHWYTGGGSERSKALRSQTPPGFANAFYLANHKQNIEQLKLAI